MVGRAGQEARVLGHDGGVTSLESLPLAGRSALVTGVSRRRGIGFAVAARLARLGASVGIHHHAAHDGDHHGEAEDVAALLSELRDHVRSGARLADVAADLAPADGGRRVVDEAAASLGHLDVLVCDHAHAGTLSHSTP